MRKKQLWTIDHQDDIQEILLNHSEISCILHCENDKKCSRIGYLMNKDSTTGSCLLLNNKNPNQIIILSGETLKDVSVYEKVEGKTLSIFCNITWVLKINFLGVKFTRNVF